MKWFVGFLAVAAILFSAGSLYYAYTVGVPVGHELDGVMTPDAPDMHGTAG